MTNLETVNKKLEDYGFTYDEKTKRYVFQNSFLSIQTTSLYDDEILLCLYEGNSGIDIPLILMSTNDYAIDHIVEAILCKSVILIDYYKYDKKNYIIDVILDMIRRH